RPLNKTKGCLIANFATVPARVFIQKLEHQSGRLADWVRELLCRKSNFVVTCALANKLARIAWALTTRQQTYEA
ncbi:hypothetical protein LI002_24850, partial [Escherichia coli]|nr:hypothetical protein [Escherichia coli]MCB6988575.1 hypothetical protein [Escherichia coli]MCB7002100.1 hypothetical protein [Escherichia coli]MDB0160724.1 hypothetical protein [Escherichia coli]NPO86739.1 hypothetical protein [Escherichia coli]